MIGAIIGDIVGSPYELNMVMEVDRPDFEPLFHPTLSKFTDDSVLTCATAEAILKVTDGKTNPFDGANLTPPFHEKYKEYALKFPNKGYGGTFWGWANSDIMVKNKSYGNGCMMRCSPIGEFWTNWNIAVAMGKESIEWTHNSPESLRGVTAIVSAIWMAKNGKTKEQIQAWVEENCGHMLTENIEYVRNNWDKRNIRCNISCAQALICFMNSTDFESAVRVGVYSNGDCDTIAAIAGSVAEAYYGPKSIPQYMIDETKARLTPEIVGLVNRFYVKMSEGLPPTNKYYGFQI